MDVILKIKGRVIMFNDNQTNTEAENQNGVVLDYSDSLKNNHEFVLVVFEPNGGELTKQYWMEQVLNNGLKLEKAPNDLRKDPEIVLAAMKNNYKASKFSLLDEDATKALWTEISVEKYISNEVCQISFFNRKGKDNDDPDIKQNCQTISKILSYFSVLDALNFKDVLPDGWNLPDDLDGVLQK